MADQTRFRPPPEPAHISVVRHFEDLITIFKHLREVQVEIDRAFDDIASKVGFVFTTTMPVTMEVEEGGKIGEISLGGEHLRGTLFSEILLPIVSRQLQSLPEKRAQLHKGRYEFYVIWYDALRLKLGSITFRPPPEPAHFHLSEEFAGITFRPPPEPAHFTPGGGLTESEHDLGQRLGGVFRPPPEPAHWFDRGSLISELDQVLIVALDEVYGELKLLDRISSFRQLSSP